jgi:hypothetical protein
MEYDEDPNDPNDSNNEIIQNEIPEENYRGGSIKKSITVCKLCNNKCNKLICNKCLITEQSNAFIEKLYGGELSDTSMSESE